MTQTGRNVRPFVVNQRICDDLRDDNGDEIGSLQYVVDEGLAVSASDRAVEVFGVLTPEEIAELLANRVVIEQAKGMLMFIYGVEADEAFELLKWCSQKSDVKLRVLAEQLAADLIGVAPGDDMRAVCHNVLLTFNERITTGGSS